VGHYYIHIALKKVGEAIMARWTEEQKTKALTIAKATSITEAARETKIPRGTIGRWMAEIKQNETTETKRNSKKIEQLQEAAIEKAVEEAGDYIADRLKSLAGNLYSLAEKAAQKVDIAISDPDELPKGKTGEVHDRDGAAWLRSLVGVLSQAIDKAQLLSGKPTVRPEVIDKHEYDITQRIITERPELIDEIFAQNQRQGVANRSR
jgi:hypothetical protein